jgi:hypothetical protein
MPKKVQNQDEIPTLVLSGKMISIRTSQAMELMLEDYIADTSIRELHQIDRAEAARRLFVTALQQWWNQFRANGGLPGGNPPGSGSELTPEPWKKPTERGRK